MGSRSVNVFLTLSDHNEAVEADSCEGRLVQKKTRGEDTMKALNCDGSQKYLRFEGLPFHKWFLIRWTRYYRRFSMDRHCVSTKGCKVEKTRKIFARVSETLQASRKLAKSTFKVRQLSCAWMRSDPWALSASRSNRSTWLTSLGSIPNANGNNSAKWIITVGFCSMGKVLIGRELCVLASSRLIYNSSIWSSPPPRR